MKTSRKTLATLLLVSMAIQLIMAFGAVFLTEQVPGQIVGTPSAGRVEGATVLTWSRFGSRKLIASRGSISYAPDRGSFHTGVETTTGGHRKPHVRFVGPELEGQVRGGLGRGLLDGEILEADFYGFPWPWLRGSVVYRLGDSSDLTRDETVIGGIMLERQVSQRGTSVSIDYPGELSSRVIPFSVSGFDFARSFAATFVLVWAVGCGVPVLIARYRVSRGRCGRCDYDLSGGPFETCPECGAMTSNATRNGRSAAGCPALPQVGQVQGFANPAQAPH